MASLGNLTVFLGLNNSQLNRGAAESEKRLGTLRTRMNQVAARAGAMSGAVVAAGAAYVTHLVRDGLRAIDTNNKLAVSLRGTYDELRAVRIAADDAGIDGLDQSLTRLNRRLGAAEMNTGQAVDTLDRLGLSARDLANMGLDDRIAAIADAIQSTGMTAQEAQRHLQQLGFTQAEAVELFMQGGDAIRAARQEVDDFGLSVSQVDAAQIERANDAMGRIGRVIEGVRNQITVALAPVLGALADRFNDVARANQGFGQQAADATETALMAFGRVADVVQGLRVAAGTLQLGIAGLQTGFVALSTAISQGFVRVLQGATQWLRGLIDLANRLPVVDIDTSGLDGFSEKLGASDEKLAELRQNAVESTRQIASELHELAMQDMPSDKIAGFIEEVRERAEAAAKEIADTRGQMFDAMGGGDPEEDAQHREQLEKRLERLREQNLSELELAEERHEQHLELLREALEKELLTEQEFAEQKERTEQQHMDELARIREAGMTELDRITAASMREQASFVASGFADMTASAARGNRAMFELNKTAALASAALDMKEAITGAYKVGARIGGPPLGAAYAATAGAAQLATLNNIRSQSFDSGGGGAAPSVSQTPATPVTPVGGGQDQGGGQGGANGGDSRTLTVRNLGGGFIQQIAEELLEFQRDGGRVVFES